mgnify:CR=1 FL=1|tara:strand:+ start:24674 stop:25444 length:771 start_codon:yes stop_codon:yes gene_type:complete
MSLPIYYENWRKFVLKEGQESSKLLSQNEQLGAEVMANTLSAQAVFSDEVLKEGESGVNYEVSKASSPSEEVVSRFNESLYSGKRSGFLTYYEIDELRGMNLFLVEGHNAGFAIKTDGDIVSVHNNSSLRGLGPLFIQKAISVGGTKLDHFDGFLSGLYRKLGFTNVHEVYQWDEQYKPSTWNFDPVDIMNPKTSIYADATAIHDEDQGYHFKDLEYTDESMSLTVEDGFHVNAIPSEKINQYKYGRPDVIFRRLV